MRLRVALVALPLVFLAACGSSPSSSSTTGSANASASGSDASASGSAGSTTAAATLGPEVPPATAVAAPVAASEMPTVAGGFGVKPTLTFPKTPPNTLQRKVLVEGTGAAAVKGDFLVTNYLGQIWGGKVFDNSYDKKATSTFQIGEGKVVPGWDTALVGQKAGSRILLSLPPADGYGSAGNPSAGISGTDTIDFVIDIVSIVSKNATGQTNAVLQKLPADVPQVTGALGQEPKITIGANLKEPTKNAVYLVSKGTGPAVKAGSVLVQLVVTDWKQSQTQSTWKSSAAPSSAPSSAAPADDASKGLQSITVSTGTPISGLIGLPLGSRVLVLIAPSSDTSTGQTSASAVAVLDLVAQG